MREHHIQGKYWAVTVEEEFGLDSLVMREQSHEAIRAGEARVQLSHSALNYRDLMMIEGRYNPRQSLPLIPCSDGVGVVSEVTDSTSWSVGDRVIPIFSQDWRDGEPSRRVTESTLGGPLPGTLRQSAVFTTGGLVAVPDYLTDAEASTMGCAALTAWSALIELGKIKAGDHVLCIGTGGVSLFAAQIAAMSGARVTLLSRSEEKLARVLSHPHLSPYTSYITPIFTPADQPWGKRVREERGEVDHVVEVGGAGTLSQSLRVVRAGGVISLIGVLSGGGGELNLTPVLMRQVRIQGVIVGHKAGLMRMLKAFSTHELRPVLDERAFHLSEARQAFEYLKAAQHTGKVVIQHS